MATKDKTPTTAPSFRIRMLHDRKSGAIRKITGESGMRYVFTWDDKIKAYAYTPKSEVEVEDIFSTVGRVTSAAFGPVSVPVAGPVTKEDAVAYLLSNPEVAAKVLADYKAAIAPDFTPATVAQIEECIVRGIIISEDDSAEVVQRLLDLAYKATSAGEQAGVRKADEEIAELKRSIEGIKVSAEANSDGTVTVTATTDTPPVLTPAQKRAATIAAKKAAQGGDTKESPPAS